jgi:hypothetical protein
VTGVVVSWAELSTGTQLAIETGWLNDWTSRGNCVKHEPEARLAIVGNLGLGTCALGLGDRSDLCPVLTAQGHPQSHMEKFRNVVSKRGSDYVRGGH